VRPLNQERKSPKTRGNTGRTPSRGITRGAPQPYGRRTKSNSALLSRVLRFCRVLLDARRPMLWATLTLVLLLGVAVVLSSGVFDRTVQRTDVAAGLIATDAGFGISQVHLAGNVRTAPGEIMTALGFSAGQPIFNINLRAARARLMQLAWVADAEVKRRYPDDISVQIVERMPFARWQKSNGLFVVERNGRPITAHDADKFVRLPLLIGDGAPQAAEPFVSAVAAHRAIAARVAAYQYVSRRRWNLVLDDGVIVKLPEDVWQKQLQVLDHLIVDKGILETDIREIDLRHPGYYFFSRRSTTGEKDKKPETGSAI
jgi:cell division protein FtsQ